MNVEILAVGTELLLGQHVNTNATEIAARLAESGLTHLNQAVVGDNPDRMRDAIVLATERSDALIITGGIGPTGDDITREVVAAVANAPLECDESFEPWIRARWADMRPNDEFPLSNLRQAYRPQGAAIIRNRKGTAPGFRLRIKGCWVMALPGVPAEMHAMLESDVLPFLREQAGEAKVVVSRLLRTYGMSEADVGERLADVFESSTNPTIAFLASAGEIKVRLTALAGTDGAASAMIEPVESEIRERLGYRVFGADDETIERVIHTELVSRGWTIGSAESATGGAVGQRLTSVPGSSASFRGSVIAYAADLKTSVLGVPREILDEFGVVSEETALAMARGACEVLGVDVAVAVTGAAGPEPLGEPAGTMIIAVVTPVCSRVRTLRMPGDRERVRKHSTTAALHQVRRAILNS